MPTPQTHAFISYCHDNEAQLSQVIERLKEHDVPYWFDKSIEAGIEWRPEIDAALAESFAVLVIVTPQAMKSTYVTYEWSWALGSSIPVFPLLMTGSYDNVHKKLLDNQCVDCRNGIPDSAIEAIDRRKRTPPDIAYLSEMIVHLIIPLRVQLRIVIWFYAHLDKASEAEQNLFDNLLETVLVRTKKVTNKELPGLIIKHSHALTSKQRQKCRTLIEMTDSIESIISHHTLAQKNSKGKVNHLPEVMQWLTEYYQTTWLPVVRDIDEKYWAAADSLDTYLGYNNPETDAERRRHEKLRIALERQSLTLPEDERKKMEVFMASDERKAQDRLMDDFFVRTAVQGAYKDKELANIILKFARLIHDSPV